nr:hypothetical protein [Streptomyces niphimycinicus]
MTGPVEDTATGQDVGPGAYGLVHHARDTVPLGAADQRTVLGGRIEAVAHHGGARHRSAMASVRRRRWVRCT